MRESLLGAFWLTALGLISYACTWNLSSKAERVLKMAGENRPQLEKVLAHYRQNESDSLKLKAAHFLIENMDGHFSYDSTLLQEYRPMLVVYDSLIRYRKAHPQLNLIEHMIRYGVCFCKVTIFIPISMPVRLKKISNPSRLIF